MTRGNLAIRYLAVAAAFVTAAFFPHAASAYYMTPATGYADFATPGNSVVTWAFPEEVLHQDMGNGRHHIHLEMQTKAFTDPNTSITYGPGTFTKGTASGLFKLWIGSDLTPNSPQFWWPGGASGGATQAQPPAKNGQNLAGYCSNTEGISTSALSDGYTQMIPVAAMDANGIYVFFQLTGPGKANKNVTASDFITSGQVNIHCDVFYMIDE